MDSSPRAPAAHRPGGGRARHPGRGGGRARGPPVRALAPGPACIDRRRCRARRCRLALADSGLVPENLDPARTAIGLASAFGNVEETGLFLDRADARHRQSVAVPQPGDECPARLRRHRARHHGPLPPCSPSRRRRARRPSPGARQIADGAAEVCLAGASDELTSGSSGSGGRPAPPAADRRDRSTAGRRTVPRRRRCGGGAGILPHAHARGARPTPASPCTTGSGCRPPYMAGPPTRTRWCAGWRRWWPTSTRWWPPRAAARSWMHSRLPHSGPCSEPGACRSRRRAARPAISAPRERSRLRWLRSPSTMASCRPPWAVACPRAEIWTVAGSARRRARGPGRRIARVACAVRSG